jgi:hypothetical protein
VRDPLWMLARQWQVGEFTAEDAGSPLQVRAVVERAPLTRYLPGAVPPGGGAGRPYDPDRMPLEVLVESEPVGIDFRLRVDAGMLFLRMLTEGGAGKYRDAYVSHYKLERPPEPVGLTEASLRQISLAVARMPDSARLAQDLRAAGGALPAAPPIDDADREKVISVARDWLSWFDSVIAPPSADAAAWKPERMEYAFAVAAPSPDGERTLIADGYSQGRLDWHAFDYLPEAGIGATADASSIHDVVRTAIPAPVSYRGMPVARWWEFEDGQLNFGTVDAGPTDLLRTLLIGFALDYGNDWFLMPLELSAGATYRVKSLVVTDSFGERTLVRPFTDAQSADPRWSMFSLSSTLDSAETLLFLPPVLPSTLHGRPLEEVLLLRDEMANLGWAVERVAQDAGGRPLDRYEEHQAKRAAPGSSGSGSDVKYRLASTVPDYWFPLVPARIQADRPDIRLVRGRVLRDGGNTPIAATPIGILLEPGRHLQIFEEEVPRCGARLERTPQYARWSDGSSHLWIGRRKTTGRGEGFSGLRFDILSG